jgi:hypothetical protein
VRSAWPGNAALATASIVLSLGFAEAALRLGGFHPYRPARPRIAIEPGGLLTAPDPVLGFTYIPGRFRVTFDNGDSWMTTHRPDTLRITRPDGDGRASRRRPGLWIFGCSFVHGWGLNDDETLPWKLQERLPQYDVANFGVGGYGTLQSLLQLRRAFEHEAAPAVAVLAYAGFHDERNTLARRWQKAGYEYAHLGTTKSPYARIVGGALQPSFDWPDYRGFGWIKVSALAELADEAYGPLEVRLLRSHRVSELLVEQLAREAVGHGVHFVIAGISRDAGTGAMLRYAATRGIPSIDVSVDLGRWGNRIRWDGHPNGVANDKSAERLAMFLRDLRSEGGPKKAAAVRGIE